MAGKVLVLGAGLQGRAAILDLERRGGAEEIVAADIDPGALAGWLSRIGASRTRAERLDARDPEALSALLSRADVALDFLPVDFVPAVARAGLEAGCHVVNTNYAHPLRDLADEAASRGVALLPECGFDPGIDLLASARAVARFDTVEALLSYAGGIPAPECRDANALRYKVSWSFEGVLRSYVREGCVVEGGKVRRVPSPEIFEEPLARGVRFEGLGELDAFVNEDAAATLEPLGISETVTEAGRYALRWPGHCRLWRTLVSLGLLDGEPVEGLGVSPRELVRRKLEGQLRYSDDERDMVLLRVDAVGESGGERSAVRVEMRDFRDLETGLFAMNRTVAWPAAIVARMILDGTIEGRGLLFPSRDVPPGPFFEKLAERGIEIEEREITPEEALERRRLPPSS